MIEMTNKDDFLWKKWYDENARKNKNMMMKMGYQVNGKPVSYKIMNNTFRDIKNKLNVSKNHTLLDVSGGVGLFSKFIKKHMKDIILTDTSHNMTISSTKNNIKSIVADPKFLPFNDKSFDRVLCYSVFHIVGNFENVKLIILDLIRVLKQNGILMIGDLPLPRKYAQKSKIKMRTLMFDKYFFEEFCVLHGLYYRILVQNIEGKITAPNRFDVLISRKEIKIS
jgi:ubiquinone/menaquinone biosynthesis C-methylase UbiE